MAYAVNIADLTTLAQGPGGTLCVPLLIGPVTSGRQIVQAEPGRVDGGAVRLECDDEQANAIVHILRIKEPRRNLLRCYQSKTGRGGWKRI